MAAAALEKAKAMPKVSKKNLAKTMGDDSTLRLLVDNHYLFKKRDKCGCSVQSHYGQVSSSNFEMSLRGGK